MNNGQRNTKGQYVVKLFNIISKQINANKTIRSSFSLINLANIFF